MVMEASTLPNHKIKVAMAVSAVKVVTAGAEGFKFCQETKPSRGQSQRNERETTAYSRLLSQA